MTRSRPAIPAVIPRSLAASAESGSNAAGGCWTWPGCSDATPSRISRIENGERGTPDPAEAAAKLGVPLPDLIAPCPQCGYQPPHGYLCLRCGTQAAREAG